MTIIIAIIIFGLIIFVHELGHFIAAKLSGITVYQFTIGFGPPLFKKKIGETIYAIRLLPLGGAVMMKGEEEYEGTTEGNFAPDELDTEGSYTSAKLWQRFVVCLAGPLMNFITGVLILLIVMLPMKQIAVPELTGFMEGFELEGESGLQKGDRILNVNGFHVFVYGDVITALELGAGKPYDITVERDGKKVSIENLPLEKKTFEGQQSPMFGLLFGVKQATVGERIGYAFNNSMSFLQSAVKSIGMLISGQASTNDMMGAVGIADTISDKARESSAEMWYFVAFLSVNLAFVNLLPIPGLDGGKLLFLLIELVRRKPLNPKYEGYASMAGLVLVFGLFIFVTYHDIMRLISG